MPVDLQRVRVSAQRTAGRGRDENFPADRDESTAVEAGLDVLDAPSPPQPSLRRRICRSVVPAVVSAAVLVLLWQLFVMSGVKPTYTVPGPGQVWSALVEEVTKGHAQAAVLNSLRRGAVGFGASVIVGTALALALAQLRFVRRGVGPLLTGLQSLPSVAWVPAAILWFGLADGAIYAVVLLGAVPSIANGLLAGIDQVPRHTVGWHACSVPGDGPRSSGSSCPRPCPATSVGCARAGRSPGGRSWPPNSSPTRPNSARAWANCSTPAGSCPTCRSCSPRSCSSCSSASASR